MVEVCYRPWHREFYRVKISQQALQILPPNVSLRGRYGKDFIQFLKFSFQEGYSTGLCINCPYQEFLHIGPVAHSYLELIHAHGVLSFSRKIWEDPFEGLDPAVKDL